MTSKEELIIEGLGNSGPGYTVTHSQVLLEGTDLRKVLARAGSRAPGVAFPLSQEERRVGKKIIVFPEK